jgi:hypothetical protein
MSCQVPFKYVYSIQILIFLARKHFELRAQQDLHPLLSEEGLAMASENMDQLISSLGKTKKNPYGNHVQIS